MSEVTSSFVGAMQQVFVNGNPLALYNADTAKCAMVQEEFLLPCATTGVTKYTGPPCGDGTETSAVLDTKLSSRLTVTRGLFCGGGRSAKDHEISYDGWLQLMYTGTDIKEMSVASHEDWFQFIESRVRVDNDLWHTAMVRLRKRLAMLQVDDASPVRAYSQSLSVPTKANPKLCIGSPSMLLELPA